MPEMPPVCLLEDISNSCAEYAVTLPTGSRFLSSHLCLDGCTNPGVLREAYRKRISSRHAWEIGIIDSITFARS